MGAQWKDMKDTARIKTSDHLVRILEPLEEIINSIPIKVSKLIFVMYFLGIPQFSIPQFCQSIGGGVP